MTREEAIQVLQTALTAPFIYGNYAVAIEMAIESLSAGAEWIPCDTSGMPPEGEAVLMSDGKHIWIDETVAWWGDRSDWIGTAWMPLPKPYKGGDTANCTTKKPNDEVEQKNDIVAKPTDIISRADAIKAFREEDVFQHDVVQEIIIAILNDIPSAEATGALDDAIAKYVAEFNHDSAIMRITALPSADRPSGEWIPCNEKMPEDGQGVIICTDDKRFKDHPVGTCIYEDGSFHTIFYDDISIIAWMPLPKPYCPNCGAKMGGK